MLRILKSNKGFTLIELVIIIILIGMLAVAGGALLVELDRDRPIPPPDRPPS